MQTSLQGIANKAAKNKRHRFRNLFGLLNEEFLLLCWRYLNKNASPGIDKVDAREYETNLNSNVKALVESVKGKWYRAKLVLRKYIPKSNGKMRSLGVPAIADKLLQTAVKRILEAIYEQDFLPCSFGYRPEMGAHDAIKNLSLELRTGIYGYIVEADIKGFFDSIKHELMLEMLEVRIDDKPFLNLIRKWLKAGILDTNGQVTHPAAGTPQGGIVSPMLANVYLHYVLDLWFEKVVKAQCKGKAYLCRYADDWVCAFQYETDAKRFYQALVKRLDKFGLEVAKDKTKMLCFKSKEESKASFDFLGFEFRWGKDRKGRPTIKRRTSRKKYRASLVNVKSWIKDRRNWRLSVMFAKLNAKLRGYYNYYGLRYNYKSLSDFFYQVCRILFKWLNRRSQRKSYNWNGFNDLLKYFKILKPRICAKF